MTPASLNVVKSMTGFGAAEGETPIGRVSVEVRTVNHRFLNPSVKLPGRLSRLETPAREAIRSRIARGHVTLSVRVDDAAGNEPVLDRARIAAYVAELNELSAVLGLAAPASLDAILRLPGVVASSETTAPDGDADADGAVEVTAVIDRAFDALDAMRSTEGARLTAFILDRVAIIEMALGRVAVRAPARLLEQRDRLRDAVRELSGGTTVDEQRIAQEIALLADRLDVAEEIERFHTHIGAFRATLASPPKDGVGKRLGFLLQEMLREANTTGSKGNDSAIVHEVLVIKEELERIREQVENLE